MIQKFTKLFEYKGSTAVPGDRCLEFGENRIAIRDGIPRFTPDRSYSEGNFAVLRERHATLQLDSVNGTTDRRDTILERTAWPREFWRGKLVLECGTGAGPDTEQLLAWGARVVSVDLAGSDVARTNLGANSNLGLVQADITDLPFRRGAFDVVFCHRVLQHTPNPELTLNHILKFVKDDGYVFVHSYARNFFQMFRWKYALRPLTTRMNPEKLYKMIERCAPFLYAVSRLLNKSLLGKYICYVLIPFHNYRHRETFENRSDEWILEFGVHDTFDALSPPYDNPIGARAMERIAGRVLGREFEVIRSRGMTLLRTRMNG